MFTNPSTRGVYESRSREVAEIVHEAGGLVYLDGANLNAILGVVRPGDTGADVMHLNLHKTFSTPHGGGGPGAGPVAVQSVLEPFLPVPRLRREGNRLSWDFDVPSSIGRVRAFYGNFGMLVRALTYILTLGPGGLREVGETAVLNANYIRARLKDAYHLPFETDSLHEVVFSHKHQKEHGVTALDIAKRIMDYGFHPPTMYFPLIVEGALMIEPTESEPLEELDEFCDAMLKIAEEAETDPDLLREAPHSTPVRRLDEATAARKPVLRWVPEGGDE
jgi:glycine dehydrogenase subunit 2